MPTLLMVMLASLFLISCSSENKQAEKEENNFTKLEKSLRGRDAQAFCQNLSLESRKALGPSCQQALPGLWPRLDQLFRDVEPIGRRDNIFFLQKGSNILSYPLRLEGGSWRGDIISLGGWRR